MKNTGEVYLVPYAHLDTQWRWEYPTTIRKYIRNTMVRNFELFEKYPEHRFNFTGAIRYEMMKDYYPGDFEKVKALVAEGRWHLAGTCLDETDALVPSVESQVRNILYGHRWALAEFGRSSRDYMIPDCFGFPGNMPTIMAHCGLIGFSSQKLTWNSSVGIPFEVGVWEAPDGSGIVSALNPCAYVSRIFPPLPFNPRRMKRLKNLGRKNGVWKSFQYYGVGDIGGAPTEGSVKEALWSIRRSGLKGGGFRVRQGAADGFFGEITAGERAKLDRYRGDFLLTEHSAGTITSAGIMKRWNRRNEQMAFAAEAAACTAMFAAGLPYPEEKITSAWRRIVGSQMHDILPGTSTPDAYEYAWNDEVLALGTWTSILEDSAAAIAPQVPGDGHFLLYNPAAGKRRDPVYLHFDFGDEPGGAAYAMEDAEGRMLPAVKIDGSTLMFIPELEALGWSRYSLATTAGAPECDDPVSLLREAGGYILENTACRIRIREDGAIVSLVDRVRGNELLKAPLAWELQAEKPKQFPAWNMDWRDRRKAPRHRIEGGRVEIVSENPLECSLRITAGFGDSSLVREVSLSSGSSLLRFTERIAWQESGYSLKIALRADIEDPKVTTNWETSRTEREVNHEKLYEFPSRYWADISGTGKGVSILEDSKYGYDRPAGDTLRLTLLHTAGLRTLSPFRDQGSHDWGQHTVRWALYPHEGDWQGTDRQARLFNQPVRPFLLNGAAGITSAVKTAAGRTASPAIRSLFELSSPQAGVAAVKKAEDGDGILVRLYERWGSPVDVDLLFGVPVDSAMAVDGLEQPAGELPVLGTASGTGVTVHLDASGIASCIVNLRREKASPMPDSRSLEIAADTRISGRNGDDTAGDVPVLPAELLPREITSGSITYRLAGEDGGPDALACAGQEIEVPAGYRYLHLLVTGRRRSPAGFAWLDSGSGLLRTDTGTVPAFTGFVGQWDRRLWKKKPTHAENLKRDYLWLNRCTGVKDGYVLRDRVEWYATHVHCGGTDLPYRFGYLYSLVFSIPEGAAAIRLPDDSDVLLAGATVSNLSCRAEGVMDRADRYDF